MSYHTIQEARKDLLVALAEGLDVPSVPIPEQLMSALDSYLDAKLDDLQDRIQQRGEHSPDY